MPNIVEVLIRGDATEALAAIADTQKAGQRMAQNLSRAGGNLSRVLTVPLAAVGAASIGATLGAEDALVELAKTVDAPASELERLRDRFEELSEDTLPKSANELTRIAALGGQLGILTQNLEKFTVTAAALDIATDLNAEEAATQLAQFANIMGTAQTEFDRTGSTLVDLGNNLATTESKILEMSLRIAGAGRQAGLSEPQVLSFGGALASVGLGAEAGGTAVSKTIAQIQKAVAEGGDSLERFAEIANTSSQEFANLFRTDPAEAVVRVIEGLKKSGEDVFKVLESVGLADRRVTDALLRASNASDLLRESLRRGNEAWSENTALGTEAEKFYERARASLDRLKNEAVNVAAELGEKLEPAFKATLDAGRVLLDEVVRPAIDLFGSLPAPIQAATIALAAVAAASGPAALLMGQLIQTVASLGIVVTAVAGPTALVGLTAKLVALGSVLAPAGAVLGGLALLAGAFLAVRDAANSALETVAQQTEGLAGAVERASGQALQALQEDLAGKLEEQNRRVERLGEAQAEIFRKLGESRALEIARGSLAAARAYRDQIREQLRIVDDELTRRSTLPGLSVNVPGSSAPGAGSRAADLTKSILASEEALKAQLVQLRDGEEALLRYRLAKLQATDAEIEHQVALLREGDALKAAAERWRQVEAPLRQLAKTLNEPLETKLGGAEIISQQRQAEMIAFAESVQRAWDSVSRSISDAALNIVTLTDNVASSFKRMADAIIRELGRIGTQRLLDPLFNQLSKLLIFIPGAPTGALSSESIARGVKAPTIPGYAAGGSIPSGQLALVGEAGPELVFGPATAVPMRAGGDRVEVHQTITFAISAMDAQSVDRLLRGPGASAIASVVSQAVRDSDAFRYHLRSGRN